MTTFSQMVDTLVAESRRRDLQADIVTYLNQTIRDVHFGQQNKNLVKYNDNLVEAIAFASSETSNVWPIPAPQRFATVAGIFFPWADSAATERKPSMVHTLDDSACIWYRSGPNLVFSGYGGIDAPIWIAYFEYPRQLVYYKTALRPAVWSDEEQSYSYLAAYSATPELQEQAKLLSTNWLLERWEHAILEGGRAKLYKKLKDDMAMRSAYSAFESARLSIAAAETYENQPLFSR